MWRRCRGSLNRPTASSLLSAGVGAAERIFQAARTVAGIAGRHRQNGPPLSGRRKRNRQTCGVEQLAARKGVILEVAGSNPAPAIFDQIPNVRGEVPRACRVGFLGKELSEPGS